MSMMHSRGQAGFSMIEVLITLVILSVGLLGVSAMQLTSLKVNHGAYSRSQAVILANDIIDRMRANREAFLDGDYDDLDTSATIPSSQNCGATDGCTPAQLATQDFREWAGYFVDVDDDDNFMALINSATGTVVTDSDNNATVTISWQQEEWIRDEEDGSINRQIRGQNYSVTVRI
ncbi:type IV pilus modification protein PilV [Pseudomaricurvus alkylphenolicus]|uniref:type IV pilus modification protein PilV n=1 Tax=Pseudomaricurvus alkylphenolicus TaxID=1306991 RepID=UPI0014203753|nr:type IV pilus modification protein PilV [Pseudomaricurvus alkylphenolicus]NIB40252.1 type IV pilus modification protein PilV [Pseudomaricurvus alkylphenolicus]